MWLFNCLPSLRWGERIETHRASRLDPVFSVSPHFGGGSGLKPQSPVAFVPVHQGSPLTSVGGAD